MSLEPTGKREDRDPLLFRADTVGSSLGIYLPATVFSRFMGLVRGVVLAWLVLKGQFGLLQIAVLAVGIMHPLCGLGLNEAIARYVPQYETRGSLRAFLARAVPLATVIAVSLSALAWLGARSLGHFLFAALHDGVQVVGEVEITSLGRLVVISTFCSILYFLTIGVLRGLRMFRAISLIETAYQAGFTLAAVVVGLCGGQSARAMLVCYAASLGVVVLLFVVPMVRAILGAEGQSCRLTEATVGEMPGSLAGQLVRFSFWVALAAVTWQALQSYPMWYLNKAYGQHAEITDVFGGMRLVAQAIVVIAAAIATVVQTAVTKLWESQGRDYADRRLRLAFKTAAMVLLLMSAVISILASLLVRIYPPRYEVGAAVLPMLTLTFLICAHLLFLAIHFTLIEKPRYVFLPWCLGMLCNAAFASWLVRPGLPPEVALTAAGWAGVLGNTPALLACVALLKAERRPFDAGMWVLLIITYALALPLPLMVPIVALTALLAGSTTWIFSHDEKLQLRDYAADGHRKARQILSQLAGWM